MKGSVVDREAQQVVVLTALMVWRCTEFDAKAVEHCILLVEIKHDVHSVATRSAV